MEDVSSQNGEWFRAVVVRYEGPLVRYTERITGEIERARDVVQDAFLRLHNEMRKAEDRGSRPVNVQAWLYTVCRRRALDVARKENRMKTLDAAAGDCPSRAATQQEGMIREESNSRLLAALGELPSNQQEVVRLKFQDGLSYRDIAEVTGNSVSNVGFLIHVAIRKLRERLATSD